MSGPQRQLLQVFFRIGVFIVACGLSLVFFQPRDSPEFVVSICSALVGGFLILGAVIIARLIR